MKDVHELQAQLNCLDQRICPLLYTQRDEYRAQIEADSLKETQLQKSMKLLFGKTGMEFTFGHEMSLSLQNVNTSDKREFRSNLLKEYKQVERLRQMIDDKETQLLKTIEETIAQMNADEESANKNPSKQLDYDDTNVYPKILFLGEWTIMLIITLQRVEFSNFLLFNE